jgi:PIN domain nuclease of toxin-antitoxin system
VNAADDVPKRVLDASALLAVLFREVGFDDVPLEGSAVSAVNWSEVVQVAARRGADVEGAGRTLVAEGAFVVPFTAAHAEAAAALWPATRAAGLSLADRACLALARSYGVPALTADRAWADLSTDVEVVVVR